MRVSLLMDSCWQLGVRVGSMYAVWKEERAKGSRKYNLTRDGVNGVSVF